MMTLEPSFDPFVDSLPAHAPKLGHFGDGKIVFIQNIVVCRHDLSYRVVAGESRTVGESCEDSLLASLMRRATDARESLLSLDAA